MVFNDKKVTSVVLFSSIILSDAELTCWIIICSKVTLIKQNIINFVQNNSYSETWVVKYFDFVNVY